ncbi:MAG: ScpA family protein [Alphaproteobacteria bacterium]|jgi:segregation and condensation protein A
MIETFESDDSGERGGPRWDGQGQRLFVDIDGYEGPLDMLLALAREQKVDLANISILQLAEQYVSYIEQARELDLDIAADHLVMAAWLAYLKSRLLLPDPPGDEEPSGEELAEALAFQLRRLEAMREAGEKLLGRPRLGQDVFARGAPEGLRVIRHPFFEVTLYELLQAYAEHKVRASVSRLTVEPSRIQSMDQALAYLLSKLDHSMSWQTLVSFLPPGLSSDVIGRSMVASTFAASLELARQGEVKLRQSKPFAPLFLRASKSNKATSKP